jgi:hypothetical protein
MHPQHKGLKRCRLSEGYGHCDILAANWVDPNDPSLPIGSEFCCDAQSISQW